MAAFTPFNYDDDIGKEDLMIVCSDAPEERGARGEIEQWAHAHGYERIGESTLNVRRNLNGQRYYYAACGREGVDTGHATTLGLVVGRWDKNMAPASSATLIRERTAQRGTRLYEQYVLPRLGSGQHGKYVAMDVKVRGGGPGDYLDYEVGDSELTVAERLLARHPDAILYTVRVGYPAVVIMRRHASGTAL